MGRERLLRGPADGRPAGVRMMTSRTIASVLLAALLMSLLVPMEVARPVMASGQDDELARLSAELNQTRAELAKAERDRDAYAQRLEDSTLVLITALLFLIASWVVFWLASRRQSLRLREMVARGELKPPQRRQRRKG